MKLLPATLHRAHPDRRGAALMMAMLVLVVLILIASQIRISTMTDSRIARNQTSLSNMDLAIESAFLKVFEDLASDAEAAAQSSAGGGGGGADPFGAGGGGGGGGDPAAGDGGGGGATDSSRDEWARPGRTEINELQLRVFFQDEDSKYNVLGMLTEDEDEAEKARDRVVRILDFCREGTDADIDRSEAESMADAMLEHMRNRSDSLLPRPELLTDDEDEDDLGLPMSLREFVVLPEFHPSDFRDYRDSNGEVVHSIESFLTLWTSLTTVEELNASPEATPSGSSAGSGGPGGGTSTAAGQRSGLGSEPEEEEGDDGAEGDAAPGGLPGGGASGESEDGAPRININRAPVAVLKALMDDRDVPMTFWDALLEYRNEEDEELAEEDDEDPPLDEFGNEIIVKKIFTSESELAQIDGWERLEPIVQAELRKLTTVQSHVFSIYVTARTRTGEEEGDAFLLDGQEIEEDEQKGLDLLRTVRCIVWRRTSGDEIEVIPLVRWEVLDYVPFEVLDYPDEDR